MLLPYYCVWQMLCQPSIHVAIVMWQMLMPGGRSNSQPGWVKKHLADVIAISGRWNGCWVIYILT